MTFPSGLSTQGSNRIDVTNLIPFSGVSSPSVGTTYTTALSITGRGLLNHFYTFSSVASTFARITVDGVVVVALSNILNHVAGLTTSSNLQYTGSSSANGVRSPTTTSATTNSETVKPYLTTDESAGVVLLDTPIYFYRSLLLELKASAPATTVNYFYSGAYRT